MNRGYARLIRRANVVLSLLLVATLLMPSPTSAQIPPGAQELALRQALFLANFNWQLSGAERYEHLYYVKYLTTLHRQHPNLSPDQATRLLQLYQEQYRQQRAEKPELYTTAEHGNRLLQIAFAVADRLPDGPHRGVAQKAAQALYTELAQAGFKHWDAANDLAGSTARYSAWVDLMPRQPEILADAQALALTDRQFATTFNSVLGARLRVDVRGSAATIYAQNPELPVPDQIKAVLNNPAALSLDPNVHYPEVEQRLKGIDDIVTNSQKTTKEIADTVKPHLTDEDARKKEKEKLDQLKKRAEEEAKQAEQGLKTYEAGLSIFTAIIRIQDPKAAKQFQEVTKVQLSIAKAFLEFNKTLAAGALGAATGPVGAIIFGSQLINAVFSFIKIVEDDEADPTPEQILRKQITALTKQVEDLRREMRQRFDRIDKMLATIFQRIEASMVQLRDIRRVTLENQQNLLAVRAQLDGFERRVYQMIEDLALQTLKRGIGRVTGYKESTSSPMPPNEFANHASDFRTWGTQLSRESYSTLPPSGPYTDEFILGSLRAGKLEKNLNQLSALIQNNPTLAGLTPLRGPDSPLLPNPRIWGLASNAYMFLLADWPELAQGVSDAARQDLIGVGVELAEALRRITVAPNGTANRELFRRMLARYKTLAVELETQALSQQNTYRNEIAQAVRWPENLTQVQPSRQPIPNIWGEARQALDHRVRNIADGAVVENFAKCSGSGSRLAAPSRSHGFVPWAHLMLNYLGDLNVDVCWTAEWTNVESRVEDRDAPFGEPEVYWYGQLQVTLMTRDGGGPIAEGTATESQPRDLGREDLGDPPPPTDSQVSEAWPSLKPQFEGTPAILDPNPAAFGNDTEATRALLGQRATEAQRALNRVQAGMYNRLAADIARPGSTLNGIAVRLTGWRALIESFVRLGMPIAFGSDDVLRSLLRSEFGLPGEEAYDDEGSFVDDRRITRTYSRAVRILWHGDRPEQHGLPEGAVRTDSDSVTQLFIPSPRHNVANDVKLLMDKLADALEARLTEYWVLIDNGTYREHQPLIQVTIDRLRLGSAMRIGQVSVPLLSVARAGTGRGRVASSPAGIECGPDGPDCQTRFFRDTAVTLTATAEAGTEFAGWSGPCAGAGTTCSVTMSEARSVTVTFRGPGDGGSGPTAPTTFALTVVRDGAGTGTVTSAPAGIECGADCSEEYAPGTAVTLTASPAAGSIFVGWSGACTGAGPCGVTMDQARAVTATFEIAVAPPVTAPSTPPNEQPIVPPIRQPIAAPSLSIGDITKIEGNSGRTIAAFTVVLSGPSRAPVTVGFATVNNTARAGVDYLARRGRLTIAPGQLTATISVPIIGDTVVEPDKRFRVVLSSPTGTRLTRPAATGTIVDDDGAQPRLVIGDVYKVEGQAGQANAAFTVLLTRPAGGPVAVTYTTANGAALAGSDYLLRRGRLTLRPGATRATILVPIRGDRTAEPHEQLKVQLSAPGGATIADGTGVGTILNDD